MQALDLPMSPKQIDFIAHSDARLNITAGAIRAGKSISTLVRWLIYCASAPLGGELVVVAKTTNTAASNVFLPLQDPALFGDLSKHVHYTRGAPSARILGRHVRVIGANDVRSEERLRGMTCAGALVDETTLIPKEFFTQLLGRMSVPGSKLFCSTNPGSPAHWLKRDFIDRIDELGGKYWHFTIDDNPSLTDEYKNAIKAEFVGLFYRRFILGQWCAAENAIYDMWDEDRHVVKKLPPIREWISAGVDYGQSNPFAAVLIGLGIDRKLYAVSDYRYDGRQQLRQLTDHEYAERLRGWLKDPTPDLGDERFRDVGVPYLAIDPSAASFIAQCHRDSMNPWPANNAVLDGIRMVSSLLASGNLLVAERCKDLRDELPSYSWDPKASEAGEDRPLKVGDHNLDALRYSLATTEGLWRRQLNAA